MPSTTRTVPRAGLRAIATTACLAAVLGGVVACSSDGSTGGPGGSSSGSQSAPATASTASTAERATTEASSGSAGSSTAAGELQQALLTASDVGTDFTAKTDTSADSPLPCTADAKPLFDQFPPQQQAKQTFGNTGDTLAVSETIVAYDAADAKQAFAAAVKGFSCASGTIEGSTVKIVKRPSSGRSSGDTESAAWDFTNGKVLGTAAVLRIGSRIAAMSFAATAQTANDINVNTILEKAGTKLAALQ